MIRQAEWLYDRFVDHTVNGLLRSEWDSGEPNPGMGGNGKS